MSAGQLNRMITAERRSAAADGYGNTVSDTWAAVVENEPAEIRPLRDGGEEMAAAKIEARGLVEILVRYSSRTILIQPSDRIRNTRSGQLFNVHYIENRDMRGKYLRIVCEYGGANG